MSGTEHSRPHEHGTIDPAVFASEKGITVLRWSVLGLLATAGLQLGVVYFSGSVSLLADTVHNFGDAATAVPLWIAFRLSRWKPNKRFTFGYGRFEDLAGQMIVLIMAASAAASIYFTISRFHHPHAMGHLLWVVLASLIGFLGNEGVAMIRIRVGREIGSAALIADGQHARMDGLTSLAVMGSAIGTYLGYPLTDPFVGLLISFMILRMTWEVGKSIFGRTLDVIDPDVVDDIREAARRVVGVQDVTDVRARWIGHQLHGEVNIAVEGNLTIAEGHAIMQEVHHQLLHDVRYLSSVTIHADPHNLSGEQFHRIPAHSHGVYSEHAH